MEEEGDSVALLSELRDYTTCSVYSMNCPKLQFKRNIGERTLSHTGASRRGGIMHIIRQSSDDHDTKINGHDACRASTGVGTPGDSLGLVWNERMCMLKIIGEVPGPSIEETKQ